MTKNNDIEKTEVKATESNRVTSDVTIDWPKHNWGIHAGEIRELPTDEAARADILSSAHIKSVKN